MGELLERLRALKRGLKAPLQEEEAEDPAAFQQGEPEEVWEYGDEAAEEPVPEQSLDERLAAAFRDLVDEPYDSSWESEAQTATEPFDPGVDQEAYAAPRAAAASRAADFGASRSGARPVAVAAAFRPAPKVMPESRPRPAGPIDLVGDSPSRTSGIVQPAPKESAPVPPKAKLGGAPLLANATVPRATRAVQAGAEKAASSSQRGFAGGAHEPDSSVSAQRAPTTPPKRGSLGGPKAVPPPGKERQMAPQAKPLGAIKLVPKAKAHFAPAAPAAQVAEAAVDVDALPDAVAAGAPEVAEVDATEDIEVTMDEDPDDPEIEAEHRLDRNKVSKQGWEIIRAVKEEFKLSAQVELGLKLLEPRKLWAVLGKNGDALRMRLRPIADKDRVARELVAKVDPSADNLVRRLEQKEELAAEEGEEEEEVQESTAVAEGRVAATQAAELAGMLAKEAAAPTPQPKALARISKPATMEYRPASRTQPQSRRSRSPRNRAHHDVGSRNDRLDRRQQGRSRSRSRSHGARRREEPLQRGSSPPRDKRWPPAERPRGSAGHANGTSEASTTDELGQWLASIDSSGVLRRYNEALHREFSSVSQLSAAYTPPPSASNKPTLSCIEPSVFQALGIQLLGHKLLFAKGIANLAGHKVTR